MTHVHLAAAVAVRGTGDDRSLLLVASAYPGHAQPLWNLPGGRQRPGELLAETVARELREETGLFGRVGALAYLSESYDGDTHFLNAVFEVAVADGAEPDAAPARAAGDHVVAAAWVPFDQIASRIAVAVVREPLLAFLRGEPAQRYAGFHDAGITIRWPDSP